MYRRTGCDTKNNKNNFFIIAVIAFVAIFFIVPETMETIIKNEKLIHYQISFIPVFSYLTFLSLCLLLARTKELKSEKLVLLETELALQESERSKSVLLSNLQGMAYRCSHQRKMAFDFVSEGCFDLTGYNEDCLLDNRDLSYTDLIPEKYKSSLIKEWEQALILRQPFSSEYEIIDALGCRKWVREIGRGIFDDCGNFEALEGIIIDISEVKSRQEKIEYLSRHDLMTGFYKRQFFGEILRDMDQLQNSLPLSFLVANINGTRFINDVFGHSAGDSVISKTAAIIRQCCHENYIPARTDGDEFTVLLPDAGKEAAFGLLCRIKEEILLNNAENKNNGLHYFDISVSFGYNTKEKADEKIEDILNTAVEYMRRRKLLNRKSSHSNILTSIKATMYERSQETQEHAQRLAQISKMVGLELKLDQKILDEMELFAMLHDIGKIGIHDRILKKPGPLSQEEWEEMKKHPEIGYRIAKSSPDLENIADYILSHHENWDGSGYPRGLKGTQIPLLSRILAVADAYDAMTEDRIYRKAMDPKDAIAEITNKSGVQFDPYIADIFINMEYPEEIV